MNLLKLLTPREEDLYFKVKASPYFWRQKAEELKYAAEIIWPYTDARQKKMYDLIDDKKAIEIKNLEPHTFDIYLSLIGFCTEALFKGVIIKDNPSFVSNGKLSSKLTTHDLIKLSKIGRIELTQHEIIFCGQAYEAMTVGSRYPIPKDFNSFNRSMEIGGHCREVFLKLYDKLYPTIDQFYTNNKSEKI